MYTITDITIHDVKLIETNKMHNYYHITLDVIVDVVYKNHTFSGTIQTEGFYQSDYSLPANSVTFANSYNSLLAELENLGEDEIVSGDHTADLNDLFDLDFLDSDYFAIYQDIIAALDDARLIVAEAEAESEAESEAED